jgi:hypothetical protein
MKFGQRKFKPATQKSTLKQQLFTYRGVSYMVASARQLFNLSIAKQQSFLTYRGVSYTVASARYAT